MFVIPFVLQPSFGQMCFTAIANLLAVDNPEGAATGKLFSKDKEIFCQKHKKILRQIFSQKMKGKDRQKIERYTDKTTEVIRT